jgi:hypothetical protein
LIRSRGFLASVIVITALLGCDRNDYTTWSCTNDSGERSSMVLKKAQMQFKDRQFNYCGSLGPNSFFDLTCPAQIQESSNNFMPSTGKLILDGKEFQCNAL